MSDLVVIRPGEKKRIYGSLANSLTAIEPPMWAGLIAGYVRQQGYSVHIIDADAEGLDPDEVAKRVADLAPLVAGVVVSGTNPSASTTAMPAARRVLQAIRNQDPGIKTFLAGLHPSALPERTLCEEPADYVIQGEMFFTTGPLVDAIRNSRPNAYAGIPGLWYRDVNKILKGPTAPVWADLDQLPMVAWDLLPMHLYRAHNWHCFAHPDRRDHYSVIYTSLGCPFECSFCCINAIFGKPGIRYRSPASVLEEIDLLVTKYGVRNIKIMDEMFVLKKSHVLEICDGLIDRKYDLNIWAYARIDTVNNQFLEKLKAAGFNWLAYGIESGNQNVRDDVAKGRFDQSEIKKVVAQTKESGIAIGGNFIFGLPEDNMATMQETLALAVELNCEYANFYAAMAYPGSELYRQSASQRLPLSGNWATYSQFSEDAIPMPTRHLSSEDVLRFRDRAFDTYYRNPKYLQMIESTFGPAAVLHIREMLKVSLRRNLYRS